MPKSKTYEEFVDKFRPRKTTDDCMTPPAVYDAVRNWVCTEYGVSQTQIVRPFWPGEKYEEIEYAPTSIVVDNPPFSILVKIIDFYMTHDVKFFLFAPCLTLFSSAKWATGINHIVTNLNITYENGATVPTGFVTNLGEQNVVMQTAPDLEVAVRRAIKDARQIKRMPKYNYPSCVVTAARMRKIAQYVPIKIYKNEAIAITALDSQRMKKSSIFGGGLLVSAEKAAELEAAGLEAAKARVEEARVEEARVEEAAIIWELSQREKEMQRNLGK